MGNRWSDLVDTARRHDTVIVTGCQRTGTTFCAKALAKALSYRYVDEMAIGWESEELLRRQVTGVGEAAGTQPKVIQAPALLHVMEAYQHQALLVVMQRDEADVVRSMLRINWYQRHGQREYEKLHPGQRCPGPLHLYRVKQAFASRLRCLRLAYTDLKDAPGFVSNRYNWKPKQTTPANSEGSVIA